MTLMKAFSGQEFHFERKHLYRYQAVYKGLLSHQSQET